MPPLLSYPDESTLQMQCWMKKSIAFGFYTHVLIFVIIFIFVEPNIKHTVYQWFSNCTATAAVYMLTMWRYIQTAAWPQPDRSLTAAWPQPDRSSLYINNGDVMQAAAVCLGHYIHQHQWVLHPCLLWVQCYQGRIFQKIWLPSFTQNLVVLWKTGKKRHVFGPKSGQKPMKEQS